MKYFGLKLLLLIFLTIVISTLVILVTNSNFNFDLAGRALSGGGRYYGKGIIYYTEFYEREDNSLLDVPIIDDTARVSFKKLLIKGTDCSRYFDLTEREIERFKDLELDYIILGFGPASWYNLAPNKPLDAKNPFDINYNFSYLDKWVGLLQNNGFKVILQLWGTPTWASGADKPVCGVDTYDGKPVTESTSYDPYGYLPENFADFADFTEAVVKRYDGNNVNNPYDSTNKLKISDISLLNEPNVNSFFSGTSNEFKLLNNLAYDRIKEKRPDVTIWGGNLLGNWSNKPEGDPVKYFNSWVGELKFDVFALHPYPKSFNSYPLNSESRIYFSIGNLANFFKEFDKWPKFKGKPIVLTEVGNRSNWENNFDFYFISSDITEEKKASWLKDSLDEILNINRYYSDRIIGVTNNTYYNSWRWWSTGLVNYYDPKSGLNFDNRIPAYYVFKEWNLKPTKNIDAAYFDKDGNYTIVKNDRYWYRKAGSNSWYTNTLFSAYSSGNFSQAKVPMSDIDSAYFEANGNYTIIKGDRYWYRKAGSNSWYTNTLVSAYNTGNFGQVKVPTSNIDSGYFDFLGNYTVVKGDRYWYRSKGSSNWYTNTLESAYSKGNYRQVGVPVSSIDSGYFDAQGNYSVVKDNRYWTLKSGASIWESNLLETLFY